MQLVRVLLGVFVALLGGVATAADKPPRLVLQITVDQLRGDMPARYLARMSNGGFRYLLDEGVVYRNAHHAHAMTETVVGHATLATGAYPSEHGLVGNVWLDRDSGEMVYNVEDGRYPLLTADAGVDKSTEIDPTQRVARSDGRSPAALLVSTFGDELALHTAGQAKVFGVSVKDRGAVTMAGHAGKAFWFSKASGEFVSSRFYYEDYPDWVKRYNEGTPANKYADAAWQLARPEAEYVHGNKDDQPWKTKLGSYGRIFPHQYGPQDGKYFTTFLTISPAGDELTVDFAKALILNEELGQDLVTDYLSVSLSSTDYVGHVFGPSSLESEDNLLRLDRTLADLFSFVDEQVGLKNTLIVLSADHGGPDAPPLLKQFGINAGYVYPAQWDKQPGMARLKERFGVGEELIRSFWPPYVYLNREVIAAHGLEQSVVQRAVAQEVIQFKGVSQAIASADLMRGAVSDTELMRLVRNSYNPRRSGDVFVVFEPQWFVNDFDGLTVAVTHGSPWTYDTYVPVIFAGFGLKAQTVARRIETVDIASTLAGVVKINLPSGARGEMLSEVVR